MLFHVEHLVACRPLFIVIVWCYLAKYTNRILTSAGDTPGMREACPNVAGFILLSFCRASMVIDCSVSKSKSFRIFIHPVFIGETYLVAFLCQSHVGVVAS